MDAAREMLGIAEVKANGEMMSQEEVKRLVEIKRLLPKRTLKPLRKSGETMVYTFPHDIWHVVCGYLETLSLLKIEKTCKALYYKFNKPCSLCDNNMMLLDHQCASPWRRHYALCMSPFS